MKKLPESPTKQFVKNISGEMDVQSKAEAKKIRKNAFSIIFVCSDECCLSRDWTLCDAKTSFICLAACASRPVASRKSWQAQEVPPPLFPKSFHYRYSH